MEYETEAATQERRQDEEADQAAALEAEYAEWAFMLENDRTERLLRESGICEF